MDMRLFLDLKNWERVIRGLCGVCVILFGGVSHGGGYISR